MEGKPKKKSESQKEIIKQATSPPQERVDADLVEDSPDSQGANFDLPEDVLDNAEEQLKAQARAGAPAGGVLEEFQPSAQMNPYVSEEEQGMEMRPALVGPPSYGSPRPETSAGKLVALEQHPLRADALPEDHPAAISADYGKGQTGTLKGVDTVTSRPSAPLSDMERDVIGERSDREADEEAGENATDAAKELAAENDVSLSDVEGTGTDGRITKDDVQNYIDDRDNA
jgi:pyruvate/2-oxoglutarate dehydrogenase complex dihydrolipoamide acyltransferase (E2) component